MIKQHFPFHINLRNSSGSKVCITTMNDKSSFMLPPPEGSSPARSSGSGGGLFGSSPEKSCGGGGGESMRGRHFIPERQLFVVLKAEEVVRN